MIFIKIQHLCIAVTLVLVSITNISFAAEPSANELNNQAVQALESGKYEAAIKLLKKANEQKPNEQNIKRNLIIAYNASAMHEARLGKITEAKKLFQKAFDLSTLEPTTRRNYFASLNNYAVKKVEQGDFQTADEIFRELENQTGYIKDKNLLTTYSENYTTMLLEWGRNTLQDGNLNFGRNLLYRVIAQEPENIIALRTLGDHFYDQDMFGLAREYYIRSAKIDSKNKKYYNNRIKQCALDLKFEKDALRLNDLQNRFQISYTKYLTLNQVEEFFDLLGNAYYSLSVKLGREPQVPIYVKIYDSGEFHTMHGLPHWAGGFFDGKLRVPANLLQRDKKAMRKVAYHEITHVFLSDWLGDKLEFWLHEGLAQYFEHDRILSTQERKSLKRIVQHSRQPFDEIRTTEFETFKSIDKVKDAYVHSKAFVYFLIDRYDFDAMLNYLKLIEQEVPSDDAFRKAFGRYIEDLHVEWRKWGRKNY